MSTVIAYYSGTGNTFSAAEHFNAETLIDITKVLEGRKSLPDDIERLGIFSPVYYGGLPLPVREFIQSVLSERDNSDIQYVFTILTKGGNGRTAERIMERALEKAGLNLSYSASLVYPDWYLPLMKGKISKEKNDALIEDAGKKLEEIKAETDEEKISLPPFSPFYRFVDFFSRKAGKPKAEKNITVNDRCTLCGLCSRICPAGNISIENGKAVHRDGCLRCYACTLVCPEGAVEYKGETIDCPLTVEKEKLLKR